jgi:hypothetical protein
MVLERLVISSTMQTRRRLLKLFRLVTCQFWFCCHADQTLLLPLFVLYEEWHRVLETQP